MTIETAIQELIDQNKRFVQKYGVTRKSIENDNRINAILSYYHQTKRLFDKQREPVDFLFVRTQFSYYQHPITNKTPYAEPTLFDLYHTIKYGHWRAKTEQLRAIPDKAEARQFKASNFDYVTFSGTFTERDGKKLKAHSNLMVFDFDHVPDLNELKEKLLNDEYFSTLLMFVSPSGDGLKWVVSIDVNKHAHETWFTSISAYLEHTYKMKPDPSGKDVARACFICHDPDVYINPVFLL